ncbi:phosphoserine phosphatase SerB, partial [Thioclava sp. BHET1]
MFIATLLTDPARADLGQETVDTLRNAWGGGEVTWLDTAIAAEFALESLPSNRWESWEGLQSLGVDLIVQPQEGR